MIEGSVKGPEGTTAPETEKRVARDFRYSAKWKGSRRGAEAQRRRGAETQRRRDAETQRRRDAEFFL